MADPDQGNLYQDVKDVNPIIEGIELEEYDPDDDRKKNLFRQPDNGDTSTIGEEIFHPEANRKKSRAKTRLKGFIVVAVVVAIIIAIICLVIFLGPEIKGPSTKAPTQATPSRATQTGTPTTGTPTTGTPTTMVPTVIPGVVIGDVNVKIAATLNGVDFISAFNDPSSPEYVDFASKAETEMMNGLQNNDQLGDYITNVTVTSLRPGSVIVGADVSVSGAIAMDLSEENFASAFDIQLVVANQVSNATNEAVMISLSNNVQLGSLDVIVEVTDVTVSVTVNGINLPDNVTPGPTCDEGFFRCNNGTCISDISRCDYLDQCLEGEDEQLCGECTNEEFQCGNGKCIPIYWRCNYHIDCKDSKDETGCGQGEIENITLVQGTSMIVQTPTYPSPYPPLQNSYWAINTEDPDLIIEIAFIDYDLRLGAILNFENGTDLSHPSNDLMVFYYRFTPETNDSRVYALQTNAAFMFFYPGPYPGGRGFVVVLNAIDPSTYTPAPCRLGEFQCAIDGECIPSYWQCDGITDCADSIDEDAGICADFPPPGECVEGNHQYQCSDGSCIHATWVCDWIDDCPGFDDELNCPCDLSNSFQCGSYDKCIPDFFVCNWFIDCYDWTDETNCGGPNSTDSGFLNPGESVNFTSPNYPNDTGSNVYYLFTFETNVGYQIKIDIYEFSTALGGFATIGDGLDPTNFFSGILALNHYSEVPSSSPITVTSSSSSLWIEIHGGPYGFDVLFASATSVPLTCGDDEYACPRKCIPQNYRCDLFHDCFYGEDEIGCGHEEKVDAYILVLDSSQQFTSPNYSTPYVGDQGLYFWSFDASAVEGDYIIKFTFHPYNISASSYVAFGSGLDFTNQSSFYAGYEGQRIDLYNHYSTEKQVWVEFYTGMDDASYPGFSATAELILRSDIPEIHCSREQYACSDGIYCIPGEWQCDEIHDCSGGEDESNCEECTRFQFECPDTSCIAMSYICDFYPDCVPGYTDESDCPHPPVVHQEISVDTSYEFKSPLYPDYYIGNKTFYPYTFTSSDPSKHIMFEFSVFQLGPLAALSFGTGHDYFDFSSVLDVFDSVVPPGTVYAPSDRVWVDFYSGSTDNQGFLATVSTYPAGLIPPEVVCNSNQWACHDGLYCIPLSYRCDGHHDCPSNGEDEHGCPSACRPYEFECKNGDCLPEYAHCNGLEQCLEGEDEVGCVSYGECTNQQFRCGDGQCIPAYKRCNYFYDCPDLSDESQAECGQCNELDHYTCSIGNCIPIYWLCDFFYDCAGGDDEMQCHILNEPISITLALGEEVNITSENWPDSADPAIYQLWHITAPEGALIHFDFVDYDLGVQSFIIFSDGHTVADHSNEWAFYSYLFNPEILLSRNNTISVQYYSGAYVGTRGFFISMRAVHGGHVHPPCADTAYQCADDYECIPPWWVCNGFQDCTIGDDETNCTNLMPGVCGVHPDEYRCNGTEICLPGGYRCDYKEDCPGKDDEFNCTCKENEFQCLLSGMCLTPHFACDFYYDCPLGDRSDEIVGCGEPASVLQLGLQVGQLFTFTSTSYPDPYLPKDYRVYIFAAPDDYVVRVIFNDFSIDWNGFLVFGHGTNFYDHDQVFAIYKHHDNPMTFYTPTNVFYVVFHGGPYGQSRGFNISMIPIEKAATPTVTPPGTCKPGQFACLDGTCYPGFYECDGYHDCLLSEDEEKCFANGGTCQSHQFTCNDGPCIHESWRCDVIVDCEGGEDEENCPCPEYLFQCKLGECIPSVWECDYYVDCEEGVDESSCGPCEDGQYTCSDGACIPEYFVCDAKDDCYTKSDEMNCGTLNNTVNITLSEDEEYQIQSPGYPTAHDSLCYYLWIITVPDGLYVHVIFKDFSVSIYSYLSMGTGHDEDNDTSRYAVYHHRTAPNEVVIPSNIAWIGYHCGVYANARGFDLTVTTTNISSHVFANCTMGQVQCYDGHCIESHLLCDGEKDCSMGEDESNGGLSSCSAYDRGACGNHDTEFMCLYETGCVHDLYRCDYIYDCLNGSDELNCPRNCTEHEFECPDHQCIPNALRCNFFPNCAFSSEDELNCGTVQNTEYIFLNGNITTLTSPNFPGDYPKNTYRVTHVSTLPGQVINVTFNTLELSVLSYLVFGNGTDTQDFSNIFEVYTHRTSFPSSLLSLSNELFIEFFTNIYGGSQGHNFTLEAVDQPPEMTLPPCNEYQFQCERDGTCIPLNWLCDGWIDCGDNSDEEGCQGTCHSSDFACDNGVCIDALWRCDSYVDCQGGEDEENCTSCAFDSLFHCSNSSQCIFDFQVCNHLANCELGEDEAHCDPCGDNFFTCSNGGCVPNYWRCDGDNDCFDGGDETNCDTIGTVENITLISSNETENITSPGYPMRYGTGCYAGWEVIAPIGYYIRFQFLAFELAWASYVTVGTGLDHGIHDTMVANFHHRHEPRQYVVQSNEAWIEFHCGPFGGGLGFQSIISAIDSQTYVPPTCPSDEFMCDDGNCIETFDRCNGVKDCLGGEDEDDEDCANFDHFQCDNDTTKSECPSDFGSYCIYERYVCDGIFDCPYGQDESNCTCHSGQFECPDRCVPATFFCDGYADCFDLSDERGCAHINNTESYNLTNPINITSPNYPNYYPTNDYTVTYFTVPEGQVVRVRIIDFLISHWTFITFIDGHETDFLNADVITSLSFFSEVTLGETEIQSFGNTMAIEFHSGFYGGARGFVFEISAAEEPSCASNQFTCSNGQCIPLYWECDNYSDCLDHSDEALCPSDGDSWY